MPGKRYSAEQIVNKLREAAGLLSKGKSVSLAAQGMTSRLDPVPHLVRKVASGGHQHG